MKTFIFTTKYKINAKTEKEAKKILATDDNVRDEFIFDTDCEELKKPSRKILHNHTCDRCGKPATKNIQEIVMEYNIDKEGGFDEIEILSVNDGYNFFLCDNCEIDDLPFID